MEVIFIVEPDDKKTKTGVEEVSALLEKAGVTFRVIETDGKTKLKGHALNCALKVARGEIVCVYDADDKIEKGQLREAVTLMLERRYDALGVRVYRYGRNLIGKLIFLETLIWYHIYIPLFKKIALPLLSGEGLFIRRDVIEEVGGFPEVLVEDAYISILLVEKGKRVGLLDSVVYELAPKNLKFYILQNKFL